MAPKFISELQARTVLGNQYPELFKRLERALMEFSRRTDSIIQPVRTCLNIPQHGEHMAAGSMFVTMPAYSIMDRAITTKLLSFFPGNRTCPVINAIIALFDVDSGVIQAILEGNAITEIRTAMVSAVAVHHLADPSRMRHLAILGSGVQARGHIDVFKSIFNFSHITIWSRTRANANKLAEDKDVVACGSVAEAVKDADVIVTATGSSAPILERAWLKPQAVICSVGACRAEWRELTDDIMTTSIIVTDTTEGALVEAGDIVQTGAAICGEIGEIIDGRKTVDKSKMIVFKSLGMAVEDTVAAKLIYEFSE